jgi:sugar phosphate permease
MNGTRPRIFYGGLLPSMPIMSVHYFGRAHLGKILGVYKIAYDVAAASAPLFTAYLYDLYGTYRVPDVWNSAFAWVGVILIAAGLPPGLRPASVRRGRLALARSDAGA